MVKCRCMSNNGVNGLVLLARKGAGHAARRPADLRGRALCLHVCTLLLWQAVYTVLREAEYRSTYPIAYWNLPGAKQVRGAGRGEVMIKTLCVPSVPWCVGSVLLLNTTVCHHQTPPLPVCHTFGVLSCGAHCCSRRVFTASDHDGLCVVFVVRWCHVSASVWRRW
jgi:hypothetical protein